MGRIDGRGGMGMGMGIVGISRGGGEERAVARSLGKLENGGVFVCGGEEEEDGSRVKRGSGLRLKGQARAFCGR